jgi:protein O-GlcNAc transferase
MSEKDAAALRAAVLEADELERRGDRGGAIGALRQALALFPDFAPLHSHLGVLLQESDDAQGAIAHLERAAALRPSDARAANNLAAALNYVGRAAEAESAARRALAAEPSHEWAHFNLGRALFAQQRHDEARGVLEKAAQLYPANDMVWELLGRSLLAQERLEGAKEALRRATSGASASATAWLSLASACLHSGEHREAVRAMERAEALAPPDAAQIASSRLIALHYDGSRGRDDIFEQHVAWSTRYAPPVPTVRFANVRDAARRLRIGYVSSRFHASTLARLLIPVLSNHDTAAVEVICYATRRIEGGAPEPLKSRIAAWVDAWSLDDEALAQRMRDDRIDIAVDLAGHTPGHRLLAFARRPAPICISWLDYFDTTGLGTMDYLLTDEWHSPSDDAQMFTETLVRLPRVRLCYQPPEACPDVVAPPIARNGGRLVFGSFGRLAKLSPATLHAWSLTLAQVPDSRLVIKNSSLNHAAERVAFAATLRDRGIDTARVELRGHSSHAQMLAEYNDIDVVLDTFPYNGGITTMEALWMGKPVVTIRGDTLISRQSAALLHTVGLDELVASDKTSFAQIVATLASNGSRLENLGSEMRARLRDSSLFDGRGLASALEATYRNTWHRWLETGR